MRKYELTGETLTPWLGMTLHRIRACRDIPRHCVREGDLGGWIGSENNLSHDGDAWAFGNTWILGEAQVLGNARIDGSARVYGRTLVYGDTRIDGDARIFGDARVYGYARISGNSHVSDNSRVFGNARVYDDAQVFDYARVFGTAEVFDYARIFDYARVSGKARVFDYGGASGHVQVYGDSRVYGDVLIPGYAQVFGNAQISEYDRVLTAMIYTTQPMHATAFFQKDGSWHVRVGCWSGSIPELRALAESDEWIDTPPDEVDEARPELLAFVALCEARAARVARTDL